MELSPKQIVAELDRYIIGQQDAKKAVAIALRNRYRRSMLPDEIKDEITPKNIIMKGPTGVGKTEISRRLAKLVKAPFINVGRDVESMIRDLAEVAVRLVKDEKIAEVEEKARHDAESKIVEALYSARKKQSSETPDKILKSNILDELQSGKLDNHMLELELNDAP